MVRYRVHAMVWRLKLFTAGLTVAAHSAGAEHGDRGRSPRMRAHQNGEHSSQVLLFDPGDPESSAAPGSAHR